MPWISTRLASWSKRKAKKWTVMTNKTYRVGIVGLGGIAIRPLEGPSLAPLGKVVPGLISHTEALTMVPRVQLVGVCDLVPEVLDRFERTWGNRWPDARRYTDYHEMLSKESLDILTVATPDHLHASITVDGATAGVKAIFCEKPLATSLDDADRMMQACEKSGAVLMVDHIRRWMPLYQKIRDTIRSGLVGPLGTIVAVQGGPRAMLFRNGTHLIDIICYLAESEPAQVSARLEEGFEHWDRYKGDGGKLPENDPGVSGLIIFRNGVRALYCGTKNTFPIWSLQLSGPRGQVYTDDRTAQLLTRDPATGDNPLQQDMLRRTLLPDQYRVHGLAAAYEELVRIIEEGGTSTSPASEARKTVRVMEGILNSQQEGSRLVAVPP